jgi:hypothetical protein
VCHCQLTHFVDHCFPSPLVRRHVQRISDQLIYDVDGLLFIAEEQGNPFRHFYWRNILLGLQQLRQQ